MFIVGSGTWGERVGYKMADKPRTDHEGAETRDAARNTSSRDKTGLIILIFHLQHIMKLQIRLNLHSLI